jgi:asparagine synthase (glutamine-hydrolysing)
MMLRGKGRSSRLLAMCGICGAFDFSGAAVDRMLIGKMTNALTHRGPDGVGYYLSDCVGLGHRRLSIIDLAGGSQPISNENKTVHVIFNGEIYNFIELRAELGKLGHTFNTQSDTEVIAHGYEEWGKDCVSRFNGIFAFALWDASERRLFLARDHLGVKPLYYTQLGNLFLFASEIKALLSAPDCPRQVDLKSLGKLFALRYVPSPDTLFRNIKKLTPAHHMVVDEFGVKTERFWNWKPRTSTALKEGELVESYQELLEDAVRLQMRSDVPVGLFLSSGIDSGALLALMSEHNGLPVRTFTIGFESGEASNETADARCRAEQFGAEHTEMIVSCRDYQDYYQRYLWDVEEPVGNETAPAFYFVSKIASREVKVALSGQGADEPWAGYDRHIGVKLSQIYSQLPRVVTRGILGPMVKRFGSDQRFRRGAVALHETDVLTRLIKIYSFYSSEMKAKLFQPWLLNEISPDIDARQALARLHADVEDLDPVAQMLYIDTRANLPDDLLMVGDKTSMTNSLEMRVPYLDYRLVEFVEKLPANMKLRGLCGKYLHKKAVEKWLPRDVVTQKKKGFANPIYMWLRDSMNRYVNDCLLSKEAALSRYFDQSYIRKLVVDHEAGRQNYMRHLCLLISFELWHMMFIPA